MRRDALQLLWACDPQRQLERGWIHHLLSPWPLDEHHLAGSVQHWPQRLPGQPRVLVESGLLRLHRKPDPRELEQQRCQRLERLAALAADGQFALVHLSDEEGFDGDELYPMLPRGTPVWRNFPHPRFAGLPESPQCFPIGPRAEFLGPIHPLPSSKRPFPWAFMGTLWGGGSRRLATAVFLRGLPQGFFHGGRHFGVGLPVDRYRDVLAQSCFALCPEGDRHLDTFRLYESLQMGCIPLLVDVRSEAGPLLGPSCPLPLFSCWQQALAYAQELLAQSAALDAVQQRLQAWWRQRCDQLKAEWRSSLDQVISGR